MDAAVCIAALAATLGRHQKPEIFDTGRD